MKAGLFLTTTLFLLSPTFANTILDNNPTGGDPGGYPGTVCGSPSCDVIGLTGPSSFPGWTIGGARYDVESVIVGSTPGATPGTLNLLFAMRFNYDNGDASLAPFPNSTATATLNPGDLLFSFGPSGPGANYAYGIPLTSHDGLLAGHLYAGTNTRTAQQVLNDSNTIYRYNWPVWLSGTGATDIGAFSIATSNVGGPEVQTVVTIPFDPSTASAALSGFYGGISSGSMFLSFTSATCGNDVLTGQITNLQGDVPGGVPEPVSSALFGGGLLALAALGRKRLKKQLGK